MSKKTLSTLVALTIFFVPMTVRAMDWSEAAWFAAGAAVPLVAHEAGHQLKGGGRIDWHGTEWECNQSCNGSTIAAAGFYSEILVTEVMARAFGEPEQRAFRMGMRLSSGAHMLLYAAQDNKDFDNFDGDRRKRMRALVAVAGAYNLLKFHREF